MRMRAVFALHRPPAGAVAHLVLDGGGSALCGALAGEPAPAVTCKSCAYRWANQTPEGRSAMHAARQGMMFTALHAAMRPGGDHRAGLVAEWQPSAATAWRPIRLPGPRLEIAGILAELRDLERRYAATAARLAALTGKGWAVHVAANFPRPGEETPWDRT